jgi:carboxyl-terminal processing protease
MIKGISDQISKDKSIKGIVFDLRNNPGGYLTDAQFIASEFLPMGTKVVSEDSGTAKTELNVEGKDYLPIRKL